ncbi:hypothetical protein DF185_02175 [Marinifilum breve]|uniref:Zinc-ribbon domain-containing protein n=1 Tax=Marinifilum breve TaxID=2184082 RepID=A0A2V4A2P8_9BACT|nr:zinc ribbon domain-containing protein [Marinifilum breve]PXY02922.1 hypothetical protein DF185_02175 [Marinifilum breve]
MNCRKCNIENSDQAKYCKNCGQILREEKSKESATKCTDKLIIGFIGVVFATTLFSFVHRLVYYNWFDSPLKNVQIVMWMLRELSFIMIPFALKDKKLKIIGFILVVFNILYIIYQQMGYFQI